MESVGSIIMYFVIALSIVIFSVLAVTTRKILRAATYLLFALFATAGVYFQLDYEFLGAVQIAVYAGGIVVLFVFSILLTSNPGDNTARLESRRRVVGLIGAVAMLIGAGWALLSRCWCAVKTPVMGELKMDTIGQALIGSGEGQTIASEFSKVASSQYLLPFEAVSVLLLACIIGGVVVARKR